jgi:Mn2+/Fe2+ NRAMP family transporter
MDTSDNDLKQEIAELDAVAHKGIGAKLSLYTRKSGPGWLQGAITLGGGSLAGALYLGVVMGYNMMWLQPLAMILGVIMLSAISYVTLSTGEKPFRAINKHISPFLGWGWLIATMMANIVWCLPQFSLGTSALTQNLFPGVMSTGFAAGLLLAIALIVVWFYNSGSKGIKLFELLLKLMVGIVVLSFFGVVIALTVGGNLQWGEILSGLIPDFSLLFKPAPTLDGAISATGSHATWWTENIANLQKGKIITAFATAVGINMTFLLPYSMLRKGWGKSHRGLAIFDLSLGLIIPFVLATGCVVIAAASQFHLNEKIGTSGKSVKSYNEFLDKRLTAEFGDEYTSLTNSHKSALKAGDETAAASALASITSKRDALPEADKNLSAMMAERDNQDLATTLNPLVGKGVAQILFGVGVFGMALSTIIILMLINGFAFCEAIGKEPVGNWHRIGSLFPAVGVIGPFVWSKAAAALATPTSVIGGAMLPIAYLTFFLIMNSKSLLGDAMPTGARRVKWNVLMGLATGVAFFGSVWGLKGQKLYNFPIGNVALGVLAVLLVLGAAGFISRNKKHSAKQ